MNKLLGNIKSIDAHDGLLLIKTNVYNTELEAIIIGNENEYPYLKNNNNVSLIFKETEVLLSKDKSLNISDNNEITCTITSTTKGSLLTQVNLDFDGNIIAAVITSSSAERLQLKINDTVKAFIKANEIIVAEC